MTQIPQTPESYYSNEDNWGGYQYVPLREIIDGMMLESQDDDSYLKNTKRSTIIRHAKQGLRTLNLSVANDIRAFEITVPDTLVFPLPQDYVNYIMVSVVVKDKVTGSLRLQPLDINYNIQSSIGYLQDHNADLLFDNDGYILMAESSNAIAKPYKRFSFCNGGNQPFLDTSKLSKNGEFTIDERRGFMLFSSDLADKEIQFMYASDGLQNELWEQEVTVHKHLKKTLEDYIYYECIAKKRNVPAYEVQRANAKYKSSRHQAVKARADIDFNRIARIVRNRTML